MLPLEQNTNKILALPHSFLENNWVQHCLNTFLGWEGKADIDEVNGNQRHWKQQQQLACLLVSLTLMEQSAGSTGNLHWLCHWFSLVSYLLLVAWLCSIFPGNESIQGSCLTPGQCYPISCFQKPACWDDLKGNQKILKHLRMLSWCLCFLWLEALQRSKLMFECIDGQ